MSEQLINADFSRRVVLSTDDLPWIASPQAGVERRMLDRIGGEIARATSLVRYAGGSSFPPHDHPLGEEFLVLEGVFSDELGDYPAGTYVRNPPGSHHAPRTDPGCLILVKLRQMPPTERKRIVLDTTAWRWEFGETPRHARVVLYCTAGRGEEVTMERLTPGGTLRRARCLGGEEIFVLSGTLADENGSYGPRSWIRNPAGYRRALRSVHGATYWAKRGHLSDTP